MSRISYYDGDDILAAGRWEGRAKSTLSGRPGQSALRRLREALLALPEKRLCEGFLADNGTTCAIGALCAYDYGLRYGVGWAEAMDQYDGIEDNEEIYAEAKKFGISETLAWLIMDANDEANVGWNYRTATGYPIEEQERRRYDAVMRWLDRYIKPTADTA